MCKKIKKKNISKKIFFQYTCPLQLSITPVQYTCPVQKNLPDEVVDIARQACSCSCTSSCSLRAGLLELIPSSQLNLTYIVV